MRLSTMMFTSTVKESMVDPRFKFANHQSGSSLLEVLVAILLVSVGLLGVAGLSGATFSYNKVAQMRLTGLALVNDYADRARINVYGYDRGNYDIAKADDRITTGTKWKAAFKILFFITFLPYSNELRPGRIDTIAVLWSMGSKICTSGG